MMQVPCRGQGVTIYPSCPGRDLIDCWRLLLATVARSSCLEGGCDGKVSENRQEDTPEKPPSKANATAAPSEPERSQGSAMNPDGQSEGSARGSVTVL